MIKSLIQKSILTISILFSSSLIADEVNVYSHRHYDTDIKLFKMFEEKTGIKVNIVKAQAAELIKRIKSEGERTNADVLLTVDAGNLETAKKEGLLQPVNSDILNSSIPDYLRDKDNTWYGVTLRSRIVAILKNNLDDFKDLNYYEDLSDPKYKGMIMVRSSNNIYNQSLLAAMIAHHGTEYATKWAKGVVDNFTKKPNGNDISQVRSIAIGLGKIAIVNTYYVGKMSESKDFQDVMAQQMTQVKFLKFKDGGTHINISGLGVTKYAKNKENAIKLIEFLVSPEAQEIFANENFEYPVLKDVKTPKVFDSFGTFERDNIYLGKLGEYNKDAVLIFDNVGWR